MPEIYKIFSDNLFPPPPSRFEASAGPDLVTLPHPRGWKGKLLISQPSLKRNLENPLGRKALGNKLCMNRIGNEGLMTIIYIDLDSTERKTEGKKI